MMFEFGDVTINIASISPFFKASFDSFVFRFRRLVLFESIPFIFNISKAKFSVPLLELPIEIFLFRKSFI